MASTSLPTEPSFYTDDYSDYWEHLNQEETCVLEGFCRVEMIDGQRKLFNQIGETSMSLISGRNEESVGTPADYRKRAVSSQAYHNIRWFDEFDEEFLGDIPLPDGETVKAQAAAYGRQATQVAIDSWLGTNYEGATGSTALTFSNDGATEIASGSVNLTVAKLKTARKTLRAAYAVRPGDELICLLTASQEQALQGDTEYISSDYNKNHPLVSGEIHPFLGFKFIQTELLPLSGSDRTVLCYVKRAAVLVMGSRAVKISTRDDRNETIQVRTKGLLGATRLQGTSFVSIICTES